MAFLIILVLISPLLAAMVSRPTVTDGDISDLNCDFSKNDYCKYTPDDPDNWSIQPPQGGFQSYSANLVGVQGVLTSATVDIVKDSCLYYSTYFARGVKSMVSVITAISGEEDVLFDSRELSEGLAPQWINTSEPISPMKGVFLIFRGNNNGQEVGAGFANILVRETGKC